MTAPRFVNLCIGFISLVNSLDALPSTPRGVTEVKSVTLKSSKMYKICWDSDDAIFGADMQRSIIPLNISSKDGKKSTKWYYKLFPVDPQDETFSRTNSAPQKIADLILNGEQEVSSTSSPTILETVGETQTASQTTIGVADSSTEISKDSASTTATARTVSDDSTTTMAVDLSSGSTIDSRDATTDSTTVSERITEGTTSFTVETTSQATSDGIFFRETTQLKPNQIQTLDLNEIGLSTTPTYSTMASKQDTPTPPVTSPVTTHFTRSPAIETTSLFTVLTNNPPAATTPSTTLVTFSPTTNRVTVMPQSSTATTGQIIYQGTSTTPRTPAARPTPYPLITPIFFPLVNFTFHVPLRRDFTLSLPSRRLFF